MCGYSEWIGGAKQRVHGKSDKRKYIRSNVNNDGQIVTKFCEARIFCLTSLECVWPLG